MACNYVGETLNTLATSAAAAGTNERVHRAMERHPSRFLPRSKALVRLPGRRLPTVGGWSAAMKTHETMEVIIMSLVRPSALQCERGVWSERALTAVLHPSPTGPCTSKSPDKCRSYPHTGSHECLRVIVSQSK